MTKLLSNTSFGLIRTNPLLSTNVKLTVIEENEFELNSFDTGKILNQNRYKNFKTNENSSWGNDIFKFWEQTSPDSIFDAYNNGINIEKITSNFKDQINSFYSYGVERVNSTLWDREFKILAPIWIKDVLPSKFIIFRLRNPLDVKLGNIDDLSNYVRQDSRWFLNNEQLEVVKVFDLSNNSPIGRYLIKHKNSFIDEPKPFYASFKEEVYSEYRGISLNSGSIVDLPEDNYSSLALNDSTQIEYDEFVTLGFKRNRVVNANIINFEFMFNDLEVDDFSMNRYIGLYVNEYKNQDLTVTSFQNNLFNFSESLTGNFDSESSINYLKLSETNFKVIDSVTNNQLKLATNLDSSTPLYTQFESLSAFEQSEGRDYLLITINGEPLHGHQYLIEGAGKITADYRIEPGNNIEGRFSTRGTPSNVASAMSKAINYKSDGEFLSIFNNNQVILFGRSRFSYIGDRYQISKSTIENPKIEITGIDNNTTYKWINFNTGFDKVIVNSDLEKFIEQEGIDNIFVEAIDGTFHNIDFVFKFLDQPILDENNKITSFSNFKDFVAIQIKYSKNIKLTNEGNLIIYKRAVYEKGQFSLFPVKDFDFEFSDDDLEVMSVYDQNNYTAITDMGVDILHPNFEDFLGLRKKWKIIDKNLDEIELIENSYDRLDELSIPRLSLKSKYSPYILKWVAGENVVNQDYRLNNSETFGLLNGTPSFLIKLQNHYYYTHEWYDLGVYPSWFNLEAKRNLPQYYNENLNLSALLTDLDNDAFTSYFTVEKLLDGINEYPIKTRLRYSEFDTFNKTFYKGVRFSINERVENQIAIDNNVNSIELNNTGKYDGYKFACILVPETNEISPKNSYEFIVNEKWGWVLFVIRANLNQDLDVLGSSFDYPMLYLLKDKIRQLQENVNGNYNFNSINYDIIYSDIFLSGFMDLNLNPGSRSEKISPGTIWDIVAFEIDNQGSIPNLLTELNVNSDGTFNEVRIFAKVSLGSYQTSNDYIGLEVLDKSAENSLKANRIYTNTINGEVDIISELGDVNLWERRKGVYLNGGFNFFTGLIENISFSNIKELVNQGSPLVKYTTITETGDRLSNNFLIKFEEPELIGKVTSLETKDADIPNNLSGELKIGKQLTEKEKPFIISLQRYSTYYEPKFKDVFNFVDKLSASEEEKNRNLFLNYRNLVSNNLSELQSQTNENITVQALKASNLPNKDTFLLSSRYPLINETALYQKSINIFTNNWDLNYYDNFTSKVNLESVTQVSTYEDKNYFGSKVTKLKDEIILESIPNNYFNLIEENNNITINFNVRDYLIDYIYNFLSINVNEYLISTLDKELFLKSYINNNLIDSYKLEEFKLWGLNSLIFNTFENNFNENELTNANFTVLKNYGLSRSNDFEINITKDLFEENSFGVSIKYKLK